MPRLWPHPLDPDPGPRTSRVTIAVLILLGAAGLVSSLRAALAIAWAALPFE